MGRDRVFPRWFGSVNPVHRTPWNATILFGLLNVVFLWGATLIGSIGKMLADIVATLGLMAAIFYLLTAAAAVWFYRRTIAASLSNLLVAGVLPVFGAAFMGFVIVYSLVTHSLNGIEITFGFGCAALGLVISFVSSRVGHAPFYSQRMASQHDEPGGGETQTA